MASTVTTCRSRRRSRISLRRTPAIPERQTTLTRSTPTSNRTPFTLLLVAALCACRGGDVREAPASHASARPALAHATPGDLARELEEADRHGTWTDVRGRWQGQLLRWTVTWRRLLCADASACHVAAFPIQRPAKHGWMPALAFAPGELAKLERACGSQDPCDIAIEGT